ncbi:hypothetical protein FO519_002977 [Halicephalobus sp. NKZ332]|nr:hypothetical protein FO519_002977 [Halicephalobus sp. NKZ332]
MFSSYFTIIRGSLANEYCKFDEDLKDRLRKISCEDDWYQCATRARALVQEYHNGSWGAVVIGNLEQIHKEWIEWNISRVAPDPPVCRLVINDTVLLELFRTGYRKKDIKHDQRNFILNEAKAPHTEGTTLDICPHAILRGIVSSFSVEQHSGRHNRVNHRHEKESILHKAASTLSSLFYDEIGHFWNIFIYRDDMDAKVDVGFSLPLYVYDSKPGFCTVRTLDGYVVNAAIIGYPDEYAEIKSRGK